MEQIELTSNEKTVKYLYSISSLMIFSNLMEHLYKVSELKYLDVSFWFEKNDKFETLIIKTDVDFILFTLENAFSKDAFSRENGVIKIQNDDLLTIEENATLTISRFKISDECVLDALKQLDYDIFALSSSPKVSMVYELDLNTLKGNLLGTEDDLNHALFYAYNAFDDRLGKQP